MGEPESDAGVGLMLFGLVFGLVAVVFGTTSVEICELSNAVGEEVELIGIL